jgi:putative transposase/transposase-like zinc-binding protein
MVITQATEEDITGTHSRWELADIFREFGDYYRRTHKMALSHIKVMNAVKTCRTSYLGGHMKVCSSCGFTHPTYNSCGNRHCPKCQNLAKVRWVKKREEELLPVDYFHNVFTLPHSLNTLARLNKKVIYDILFKSVSETLLEFGENELGGKIGFISILHTWDQKLLEHIHLHCIIPQGALSADRKKWTVSPNDDFLFSVRALSAVFRGKFTGYLKKAYKKGELVFAGRSTEYETEEGFKALIDRLYKKDWVVYSKKPFAGPGKVLDYFGRYTFRTAISNERIKGVCGDKVIFTYRDRKDGNLKKEVSLAADEFIRRFLTHVLPTSFTRIRHFGFLANRNRKVNIDCLKKLLGNSGKTCEGLEQSTQELMLELTGKDILKCPRCRTGAMAVCHLIPRFTMSMDNYFDRPNMIDTS